MGFEQIDDAIIAGARIEDEDIKSDAAINPVKISKRELPMFFLPAGATVSGAGSSVDIDGVFETIILDSANAGTAIINMVSPRSEIVPGEVPTLHIWWNTTATSGILRLKIEIASILESSLSTETVVTRYIQSDAQGVASQLREAVLEFPPALLSGAQIIGMKITRDPTNDLDTVAADVNLNSIYIMMNGRS